MGHVPRLGLAAVRRLAGQGDGRGTRTRSPPAGSGPIVVVGTTRDPATPYEWSVRLRKQLANGVLVTYDGDGHTAYARSNTCVDNAIDDYYIDGHGAQGRADASAEAGRAARGSRGSAAGRSVYSCVRALRGTAALAQSARAIHS